MNLCIVGTGYVGLVKAASFAEMGNHAVCVDKNSAIIDGLKRGKLHISESGLEPIVKRNVAEGRREFSTDLAQGIQDALFILNCVGTPSRSDGSCDLSYVEEVALQIGQCIDEYKIIVNKSTVPVGTADIIRRIVQNEIK